MNKIVFLHDDFLVDGKSLRERMHTSRDEASKDFVSSLDIPELVNRQREGLKLLEVGPLPVRKTLFGCPCGDFACGAFTVEIASYPDRFEWRHFGYDNGYSEELPDLDELSSLGPFRFSRNEYEESLNCFLSKE